MSAASKYNVWLLVAVAALLRFSYLTEIEHNVDHAYPLWQALRTLEHSEFPVVGQGTSVLFANPAWTGYLYLPFVALTRSPLGVYIFIIALNSLAVWLAYRATRSLLGPTAGFIAAALMAVNPWVIEYSRASWVQSLLPFFTCAISALLWPIIIRRVQHPQHRTLLALIMLTLLTQTYLLAYLIVIPIGLLIVIFWQRIPKQTLVIGMIIFIGASLLYGLGLLNQWDNVQQNLDDFGDTPARLSAEAWNHAVRLISGADYPLVRGQMAPARDASVRQQLTQIAHIAIQTLLIIGIGRALWALRNAAQRTQAVILLLWFGLPVVLMTYVGQPVHPFYQLLGLPAGYALVGWALQGIKIRGLLLIPFVPFAILMTINSARYAQETAAAPGVHDLGALPLDYGIQLGQLLREHLPEKGIVYAEVDEWTLNSFAGTTFPLMRDTRAPRFTITPRDGGAYVVGHINAPDNWQPPAHTTLHQRIELPSNGLLTVDVYPSDVAQQINPARIVEQASEEGLTLLGYDWEGKELTTYWRVDTLPADVDTWQFAPFAQAIDSQANQIRVVEGEIVPSRLWRAGDIHRHVLTVPSNAVEIRLGQFDGPRQRNLIFLPDFVPLLTITP